MSESERRGFPRLQVSLPAHLDLNGTDVDGVALNIGLGGAFFMARAPLAIAPNCPVRVTVVTDAGALEITGRVLDHRQSIVHSTAPHGSSGCAFVLAFDPVETVAAQVLNSIFDGLSEKAISVSLKVHGVRAQHQMTCPTPSPGSERRYMPRVKVSLPIAVDAASPIWGTPSQSTMVNLSATGTCLDIAGEQKELGDRVCLSVELPAHLEPGMPHASTVRVEGEVIWKAENQPRRLGVRFLEHSGDSRRRIAAVAGQFLLVAERFHEIPTSTAIVSELVECHNELGHRIVGYLDRPKVPLSGSPVLVIAPEYAESKKAYIALAYYLASNGFHVLRYDHSNHVGESDGDVIRTTLSGFRRDLEAVLKMSTRLMPASPVGIIAAGMAGRVALKVMADDACPQVAIILSGILDLQQACVAVHSEDLILTFLRGKRRGLSNIFGLDIDVDCFLQDAIKEAYTDLRTTHRDAKQIRVPVIFFASEREPGGGHAAVKEVIGAIGRRKAKLYPIPRALRQLHDDPRKEWAMFRQIVSCCIDHLCPTATGKAVIDPPELEIGRQNRAERERAKSRRPGAKGHPGHVDRGYPEHFHGLANVPEYWHLLDQIAQLLETLPPNAAILDAGCGSGNFGIFLLLEELYRRRVHAGAAPCAIRYFGAEGEMTALRQARRNFLAMVPASQIPMLTCANLNSRLPFRDNQFDGVICNLVLGYMEDPIITLQEFMRVLAPGGRIIVTSLKPYADLIGIYRNFLLRTDLPEEVEEAERLLNATCKMKQAESDGRYRTFQTSELAMLLTMSGASEPRISSGFGSQAYIAVGEKLEETQHLIHTATSSRVDAERATLEKV